jgi:threonine/homoserine efflux transporter RhtA
MVPAVCLGGALAAVLVLPFASPLALRALDYGILAVMGGVQIPLALVLIAAIGTRYLPAPEVGLLLIGEVVLGPLRGWLALGERPAALALTGVLIVIATLVVHGVLGVRDARPQRGLGPP